jgi:hypothetical protein
LAIVDALVRPPAERIDNLFQGEPMIRSKLIGTFLGACILFAAAHSASAAALSMSADGCKLVSNWDPFPEMSCTAGGVVSGVTQQTSNNCAVFGSGQFKNNTAGYAWGMCPIPWQNGAYNFVVGTSSTATTCYFIAVGTTGGGATVYTGTRSGNQVSFYVPLTSGSYNGEIQCYLASGTGIFGAMNY